MEVSNFSEDRVQQSSVEPNIETPAASLTEKIVVMPVAQTREETQQVANTHVFVVNTVEVEMPEIIKVTVHGEKPVIQEKINQMTKHIDVPQMQVVEKTVEGLLLQIVEKTVEVPEIQTVRGAQTSESLGTTPARQLAQAETVEVDKIGAPSYRICITHVRLNTRLGSSFNCC